MLEACEMLVEIIEIQGACPDMTLALNVFTEAVSKAMRLYQEGTIETDVRTLPPVMYEFVENELPVLCSGDASDLEKARKQLNLFIVSVKELVQPRTLE